ncbi:NmrA family transcriptional regulator [Pseudonocardia sp. GCM10023141]|uniref:NmrA family transcriptional regulator n=1 Tax=Pseudonocardia sp. GCM10023141 TaxID=3252653 RepID=UPI003609F8C2
MTQNSDAPVTLVLGGNGKTGSRVAQRLVAAGRPIRIGSRSADPGFDWDDPTTWEPALDGVGAVYLSYYPDLAVPSAAAAVGAFARLAVGTGARRIVLLSGRGEPGAQAAEQAVRDAGGEVTVVRASWFNQNFSESYFLDPILDGEVALPVDAVPEPFIDTDDIADVAVAALTGDGHAGELYEVTGPRLLTFAAAVAEIAAATGREITFVPISFAQYAAALTDLHLPADLVGLLEHLFTEVLDGRNASLTDGVERALGRKPRDFSDFVQQEATAGTWAARH